MLQQCRCRWKHLQDQFQQREGDESHSCWLYTHTSTGSSCSLCSCTTKKDIVSSIIYEIIQTNVEGKSSSPVKKTQEGCGCFSLKKKSSGRPHSNISVPKEANKKVREGLLTRPCSDKTKTNGFKLKYGRLTLDIKNWFFFERDCPEKVWVSLP